MSSDLPHEPEQPESVSTDMPRDDEEVRSGYRFLGLCLRFLGMFLIVAAIVVWFALWRNFEPGAYLLIGLVGAAAHFAGRKISPGSAGTSASGALVGVAVTPVLIAGGLFFLFLMIFGSWAEPIMKFVRSMF